VFTCGTCIPGQESIYIPWWRQQDSPAQCGQGGRSLDGWVERFLLCHESRLDNQVYRLINFSPMLYTKLR